jgi:hypothetical protein
VIVDDLNTESVAVLKAKTDAPLVVDSDTPLPAAVMLERPSRFDGGKRKS